MLTTYALHHTFSHHPEARMSRERVRLAKRLERLAAGSERQLRAPRGLVRPLVHPVVTAICAAPAANIALVLRDSTRALPPSMLDQIRWFLTDGCRSPLFGRDAAAALLAISDLEHRVSARDAFRVSAHDA